MAISQLVNGIFGFSAAFARYAESNVNLMLPKFLYILGNLAGIGLVLYKFNSMGLLPHSPLDLLSSLPPPVVLVFGVHSRFQILVSFSFSSFPAKRIFDRLINQRVIVIIDLAYINFQHQCGNIQGRDSVKRPCQTEPG
jgi:hypothetical protein